MAVGDQDVFRLYVPVDHAPPVRVVQRVGDLDRDRHRFGRRQPRLRHETIAERFPLDVGHDGVEETSRLAGVQQRHDVGVLELGRDPDLAEESLGADRRGDVRVEHLDRDSALVAPIVREVDVRHAAPTQLAVDDVAFTENLLDLIEEIAHAGR